MAENGSDGDPGRRTWNSSKVGPVVDLFAIATPYLLWPAFNDISPTSGRISWYVMCGVLLGYLGWRIRVFAGWRWIPVMLFAWFIGAQQAVCGLLFEHTGSHQCDRGTGFPWVLVTALVLCVFGIYYATRKE